MIRCLDASSSVFTRSFQTSKGVRWSVSRRCLQQYVGASRVLTGGAVAGVPFALGAGASMSCVRPIRWFRILPQDSCTRQRPRMRRRVKGGGVEALLDIATEALLASSSAALSGRYGSGGAIAVTADVSSPPVASMHCSLLAFSGVVIIG